MAAFPQTHPTKQEYKIAAVAANTTCQIPITFHKKGKTKKNGGSHSLGRGVGIKTPNGEAVWGFVGSSFRLGCACLSGLCLLREHLPERVRKQKAR